MSWMKKSILISAAVLVGAGVAYGVATADSQAQSDSPTDFYGRALGIGPSDAALWNERSSAAFEAPSDDLQDLNIQVGAAIDDLYAQAAADSRMEELRDAWVACMDGMYTSVPAMTDELEASIEAANPDELADVQHHVTEVYEQSESCTSENAAAFDDIVEGQYDSWFAENGELFATYRALILGSE